MTRSEAAKICQSIKFLMDKEDYSEEVEEALNMAIETLEHEPTAEYSTDVISRQAAIDALYDKGLSMTAWGELLAMKWSDIQTCIEQLPSAQPFTSEQIQTMQELEYAQVEKAYELGKADRPKWIPVSWHETTEEERAENGYPKNWVVLTDCEMPSDEQEILVTTRYGTVEKDVCYEDGEFSLDSGYDWIDDVIAWMPLPKPYEESDTE